MPEKNELSDRLQDSVYRVFNDGLMVGLSVILAGIVILQLQPFYQFSSAMNEIFKIVNYLIIAAFAAEYILKLYVAESRGSFIADPWHVLDLFIIIIALIDFSKFPFYLPGSQWQGQWSPILRLPRVLLAILLASRAKKRLRPWQEAAHPPEESELQIATLDINGHVNKCLTRESICSIAANGQPRWMDFQHIKTIDFPAIEKATKIPHDVLESKLIRESFPRIDYFKDIPTILLWDSKIESADMTDNLSIATNDMLIVYSDTRIITLSAGKSDLFDKISGRELPTKKEEFPIRILYSLLRQKIEDYGEIVQGIEQKTIGFEEIPVNKTSPQFLEETFYLRKELQKIISNLWHFNQVLNHIKDDENLLLRINDVQSHNLEDLRAESEYMYETAQNIRESLISLIELHINTVSHDMNRVMKVIATITCLAVIPSIIGGLLGVNLIDEPYPLKIEEVFLIVFSLMLIGIYIFYKMDWLR